MDRGLRPRERGDATHQLERGLVDALEMRQDRRRERLEARLRVEAGVERRLDAEHLLVDALLVQLVLGLAVRRLPAVGFALQLFRLLLRRERLGPQRLGLLAQRGAAALLRGTRRVARAIRVGRGLLRPRGELLGLLLRRRRGQLELVVRGGRGRAEAGLELAGALRQIRVHLPQLLRFFESPYRVHELLAEVDARDHGDGCRQSARAVGAEIQGERRDLGRRRRRRRLNDDRGFLGERLRYYGLRNDRLRDLRPARLLLDRRSRLAV
mmetsp:Transcript_6838/g.21409  ORF Transcript_6838/g.21409 Transcript_6838/m.21409 type:complete len:268 (-) Transcript_6838:1237-2040(-)